jgi:hypothetical protein
VRRSRIKEEGNLRGYKFVGAFLVIASFFALAGGASAAKIKDQQVQARHIASKAVHCRALDTYLKGHLCGPNATIKKVGQAGPPGPPGPAGSGASEVFYVASAVTPESTVFSGGGVTMKASCAGPSSLEMSIATTKDSGVLRTSAVTGDDNVEYNNAFINAGEIAAPFVFTEALLTFSYVNLAGDTLTGTFQVDDDTNGAFGDTRDCVFAGHMNVS